MVWRCRWNKGCNQTEKEKALKASLIAVQSLWNETNRIRRTAAVNSTLTAGAYITATTLTMPVVGFETAFLSRDSAILDHYQDSLSSHLLDSVTVHLTKANKINSLVENRRALLASEGMGSSLAAARDMAIKIGEKSTELLDTIEGLQLHLDQLKRDLQAQIEARHG